MGDVQISLLESKKQYKERMISHYIIYFTSLGTNISALTFVLSTWPYLNKLEPSEDKSFVGYLTAASFLTQMIFSILLGYCSNKIKSTRFCIIFSLVCKLIGLIISANLEIIPLNRKYWFLFGRFLTGVGDANVSLTRTHISYSTLLVERRKKISHLASTSSLGFCIAPALMYSTFYLGEEGFWILRIIKINMYTSNIWVFIFLTLINLILMHPKIFVEHCMLTSNDPTLKQEVYTSKHSYKLLAFCMVLIAFAFGWNSIITPMIGPLYAMDEFNMSRKEGVEFISIVRTVCSFLAFLSNLRLHPICKLFGEMKILALGFLLSYVGRICMYPFDHREHLVYDDSKIYESDQPLGCPLSQTWCTNNIKVNYSLFIFANLIESLGFSITATITLTVLSKVLGTKKQGTWMGFYTFSASLGRLLSPLLIAYLYKNFGPATLIIFSTAIYFAFTCIPLGTFYCLIKNKRKECTVEIEEQKTNEETAEKLLIEVGVT